MKNVLNEQKLWCAMARQTRAFHAPNRTNLLTMKIVFPYFFCCFVRSDSRETRTRFLLVIFGCIEWCGGAHFFRSCRKRSLMLSNKSWMGRQWRILFDVCLGHFGRVLVSCPYGIRVQYLRRKNLIVLPKNSESIAIRRIYDDGSDTGLGFDFGSASKLSRWCAFITGTEEASTCKLYVTNRWICESSINTHTHNVSAPTIDCSRHGRFFHLEHSVVNLRCQSEAHKSRPTKILDKTQWMCAIRTNITVHSRATSATRPIICELVSKAFICCRCVSVCVYGR